MAYPQTSPPIPVPIPIKGANFRDALSEMAAGYSPWLLNWDIEPQYLKIRGGYKIHQEIGAASRTIVSMFSHNNDELFAQTVQNGSAITTYDVTSTPSSVDVLSSTSVPTHFPVKHARTSFFMTTTTATPSASANYYDGSTWTNWGFTESAATVGGYCGVSYKGRLIFGFTSNLYYTPTIGQVTGAVTLRGWAGLFEEDSDFLWMGVLSSVGLRADETFFCAGNRAGEVLVFAGDFPDSDNWERVAQFKIPGLFDGGPVYVLQDFNDIWVPTSSGIFSIRKLFEFGASRLDLTSVTGPIDPYWTDLMRFNFINAQPSRVSMAYWPERNKVFVLSNGFVDKDGSYSSTQSTMFVYNRVNESWAIHQLKTEVTSNIVYFQNGIYFGAGDAVVTYDEDDYRDEVITNAGNYQTYDHELESAYMKLQAGNKFTKAQTVEPVIETDFNGSNFNCQAAADFGRKVSSSTSNSLQSGYNFPVYNVGAEGSYLQYRFNGTNDANSSDGLKLYSVGMSI